MFAGIYAFELDKLFCVECVKYWVPCNKSGIWKSTVTVCCTWKTKPDNLNLGDLEPNAFEVFFFVLSKVSNITCEF